MGIWCMLASPLMMSADLRTIRPEFKEILLNKNLIKLNQDKLGVQARRIYKGTYMDVYSRPVSPDPHGKRSVAVAFLNKKTAGTLKAVIANLCDDPHAHAWRSDDALQTSVVVHASRGGERC